MSEQSLEQAVLAAAPVALTLRRILFLTLVGLTMVAMIGLLAVALSAGGFGLVDFILVVLFAVTLPWMVIGAGVLPKNPKAAGGATVNVLFSPRCAEKVAPSAKRR